MLWPRDQESVRRVHLRKGLPGLGVVGTLLQVQVFYYAIFSAARDTFPVTAFLPPLGLWNGTVAPPQPGSCDERC